MKTRNHKKPYKILTIIGVSFVSLCLLFSAFIVFHNTYFTSFWVNGQSMYPTLNKDAKYANGELIGSTFEGSIDGCTNIDYGIMNTHNSALNNIKRNDVIAFKYSENDENTLIKRVIALPGETFYITSSIDNASDNGNLYILDEVTNEYVLTSQDIDSQLINEGYYPAQYSSPITLGEDELFVMGDNRILGNSDDSRFRGPISLSNVIGVVVAIEGTVSVSYSDGDFHLSDYNFHWPRFL